MNERHLDALMNQEIDGCNGPEESRLLHEQLKLDPAARSRYRQLQDAVEALAELELEEPPPGLRAAILGEMAAAVPADPAGSEPGLWRGLLRPVTLVPLAAGLVAGMLGAFLVVPGLEHTDGLSGTVGAVQQDLAAAGAEALDLDSAHATGSLRVVSRDGHTAISLSLAADSPLEISMEHDAGTVCSGYQLTDGARPILHVASGLLLLEDAGSGGYEFVFDHFGESAPEIRLVISREGRIVARKLVQPADDR